MAIEKKYFAFISYQREDEEWAKWLAHELEHYHFPVTLNGRKDLPENLRPIFRDVDELSAGNLPNQIHKALSNSKHLIVICSPRSARSKWVNKEIEEFVVMNRADKIFPFIIDGKAFAEKKDEECFPPALLNLPKEEERLGGNINETGRDAAVVKIIAGMLDLDFDLLWQRYEREKAEEERRIREQRDNLLRLQSRFLAEKTDSLINDGDSYTARLLSMEILLKKNQDNNYPYVPELEAAFRRAVVKNNAVLAYHSSYVNDISFSPKGNTLISASSDNYVILWDVYTGGVLKKFVGHELGVISASFSKDGDKIASVDDETLIIWNTNSGKTIINISFSMLDFEFFDFSSPINCLFNPNGDFVLLTFQHFLLLLDANTGQVLNSIREEDCTFNSASFNSTGELIVTSSDEGQIKIWDTRDCNLIEVFLDLDGETTCAQFSPDGSFISFLHSGIIEIWNFSLKIIYKKLSDDYFVFTSFSFSKNSSMIVSTTDNDNMILLWDIDSGSVINTYNGHKKTITKALFGPDDNCIVTSSWDRTIRITDILESRYKIICDKSYEITKMICAKDYIITLSSNSKLMYWDYDTKKNIQTVELDDTINDFIIQNYSKGIAIGWNPKSLKIICLKTGNTLSTIYANRRFTNVVYNDKLNIVAISDLKNIEIWDIGTLSKVSCLEGHSEFIWNLSFSPNKELLLSTSSDMTCKLWDIKSNTCIMTFMGHQARVNYGCFSSDSSYIATASDDSTIKIWDTKLYKLEKTLYGHSDNVISVQFFNNSNYLLSASRNGEFFIWDLHSGVPVVKNKDKCGLLCVEYDPLEKSIITLARDGEMKSWPFATLKELISKEQQRFVNRTLTKEEREKLYLE